MPMVIGLPTLQPFFQQCFEGAFRGAVSPRGGGALSTGEGVPPGGGAPGPTLPKAPLVFVLL
jgi:hypothetical protein